MKMKYLKRFLSVLLTGLISLNVVSLAAFAEETNDSSHFTCTVTDGVATLATFDNLITDVTMPEQVVVEGTTYKFEDQTLKIKPKLFGNSTVEKVTYPGKYTSFGDQQIFYNAKSLKEVILKYDGEDFTFNRGTFYGCSGLEKLYVYAQSINYTNQASMFSKVPTTAVAYVQNNGVKAVLEELSWPGTIEVNDVSVNKTFLNNKIIEMENYLSEIDKTKYNGIEELETAIAHAKTVNENASATQTEVDNEVIALASALNNIKINKTHLSEKIAEAEAFLNEIDNPDKYVGIDNLRSRIINAKLALDDDNLSLDNIESTLNYLTEAMNNVHLRTVDRTALKDALDQARAFYNSIIWTDYEKTNELSIAISDASRIYDGDCTQEQINQAKSDLIAAHQAVTKRDASDLIEEMNEIITNINILDQNEYTEDSWAVMQATISEAEEINDGLRSDYENAISNLKTARSGLVVKEKEPAGEPFINIRKGGAESELINKKAEESMNGAVKVKLTLDCADDVSFNKYASIELKAIIAGTESYAKIVGTGTEEEAIKGEKGVVVELPLKNPIATDDDVKLTAYTWAWNGAKEHVYGITKIEYINEVGQILRTITDRTIAMDKLKTEIEKAEKIEQGSYSDESFAELTKAIESAKALEEKASKADIDKAIDALDKAVKGLKEPTPTESVTPPTSQEPSSNSQPTKPSIAPTTKATRSNADVIKDKKAAQKIMKQAKITKLKAKSKAKKKITVSWKKVKKAKGYQVEVSAKRTSKSLYSRNSQLRRSLISRLKR